MLLEQKTPLKFEFNLVTIVWLLSTFDQNYNTYNLYKGLKCAVFFSWLAPPDIKTQLWLTTEITVLKEVVVMSEVWIKKIYWVVAYFVRFGVCICISTVLTWNCWNLKIISKVIKFIHKYHQPYSACISVFMIYLKPTENLVHFQIAKFHFFCLRCARSAVYRTREMAARALVPFVLVTDVPSTIKTLLEELPVQPGPGAEQNHIHGTLLQVCSLDLHLWLVAVTSPFIMQVPLFFILNEHILYTMITEISRFWWQPLTPLFPDNHQGVTLHFWCMHNCTMTRQVLGVEYFYFTIL